MKMGDKVVESQEFCVISNQLKILYKMVTSDASDIGVALILIACIIAIFGVIGIIYHCYMWSRITNRENAIKKVEPKAQSKVYDSIYVKPFVKSLKEYETQVLEMSVPIAEDSSFEENIYEKIPARIISSEISYVTRNDLKINDFNIPMVNGNSSNTGIEVSPTANMPKNPLYCELMEEHSSSQSSQSNGDMNKTIFSGENVYTTCQKEKTTEL